MNSTPELVDNQINFDPMIESTNNDVQSHGKPLSTVDAMVAKVTHPPTTVPEFAGIPTNDARTQTIYNLRNIDVLRQPIVWNGTAFVDQPWSEVTDYSIIVSNGVRVKYFGACYGSGTQVNTYSQDYNNVAIQDNFDFQTWAATVNLYRPVSQSVSLYPNVTAFNNQGIISSQQFNPNILFGGSVATLSYNDPRTFHLMLDHLYEREQEAFVTRDAIHPDINSFAVNSWFESRKIKPTGLKLDPNNYIQILNLGKIGYPTDTPSLVPTPSQILQNSMRSYSDKFVNGAFAVNRINTISPSWMSGSNTLSTASLPGLYECWAYTIASDGSQHLVALLENTPVGGSTVHLKDTLWSSDFTWTFIRMQGITPNTNSSQTVVASPIAVKYYQTIEAQPVWNGPWNGVSRVSPKPDLAAMQLLMDTFYEMPDAMPVKYNALGSFLPFLAQALPHVLGFVKDRIGSKKEKAALKPSAEVPTTSRKGRNVERTVAMPNNEGKLNRKIERLEKQLADSNLAHKKFANQTPKQFKPKRATRARK